MGTVKTRRVEVLWLPPKRGTATCPRCGLAGCKRHSGSRRRRYVGLTADYEAQAVKYLCHGCKRHFTVQPEINRHGAKYFADDVVEEALRRVGKDGATFDGVALALRKQYGIVLPATTLYDWYAHSRNKPAGAAAQEGSEDSCAGVDVPGLRAM